MHQTDPIADSSELANNLKPPEAKPAKEREHREDRRVATFDRYAAVIIAVERAVKIVVNQQAAASVRPEYAIGGFVFPN